jgi:hypothetical protein
MAQRLRNSALKYISFSADDVGSCVITTIIIIIIITPWPESASELYRPSDRRLSAKLVATFADRELSRSQRGGPSTAVISIF